jgi:hypothetical protein
MKTLRTRADARMDRRTGSYLCPTTPSAPSLKDRHAHFFNQEPLLHSPSARRTSRSAMVSLRLSTLVAIGVALTGLSGVTPAPARRASGEMFNNPAFVPPPKLKGVPYNSSAVSHGVESPAAAAAFSPPYWVVYNDAWVSGENGPPAPSTINVSPRPGPDMNHKE